jgi:hypothetical protein
MAGRPFVYLLQDIGARFSDLVDSETRLVRAEMAANARAACVGTGLLAGAAVVGLVGLFMVAMAAATGLARLGVDSGWAQLVVALIALAIGATLAAIGIRNLRVAADGPRRSLDQLRRDFAVAKESFR